MVRGREIPETVRSQAGLLLKMGYGKELLVRYYGFQEVLCRNAFQGFGTRLVKGLSLGNVLVGPVLQLPVLTVLCL